MRGVPKHSSTVLRAVLRVGAGSSRAVRGTAMPHGRRGRTTQPGSVPPHWLHLLPPQRRESRPSSQSRPRVLSRWLWPSPQQFPQGAGQQLGTAAGPAATLVLLARQPRKETVPGGQAASREAGPASACGCPRPAASPRSPAPASRSRCGGSSWLRRAAAT